MLDCQLCKNIDKNLKLGSIGGLQTKPESFNWVNNLVLLNLNFLPGRNLSAIVDTKPPEESKETESSLLFSNFREKCDFLYEP